MSVVSNASPLINLARIGQLDLLVQLYGELVVPEAVWREVVLKGTEQPGAKEIETAPWVQVRLVTNRELVRALRQELDAGETEAIALALEIRAEFLLMDALGQLRLRAAAVGDGCAPRQRRYRGGRKQLGSPPGPRSESA